MLKQSLINEKIDQKEAEEIKKVYNPYLDQRKEIMKNTQFRVEDLFGVTSNEYFISQEPIKKLNVFLARMM